jgi:hypothetical protein
VNFTKSNFSDINGRAFDGVELSWHAFESLFQIQLYDWMTTLGSIHSMSFLDFLDLLNCKLQFF